MVKAVEVEVDGQKNQCLSFRPLPGKRLRGRFDFNRVAEPLAKLKTAEWPTPIPGLHVGIEPDGTGFVKEPLHDPANAPLREKIERTGVRIGPEFETFDGIDAESWLYWIGRAVRSGLARVVKGGLPEKLPANPKRNFIMAEPDRPTDRLAAAMDRQSALIERLLAKLDEK